jgi:putative nucleotidyltransferase with HDIG domain
MTTKQIYEKCMVPKNLQEHMLRVAALAEIILENWTGKKVNKNAIVQACLFHDIAKPMTFELAKQAQFGMSAYDIKKLGKLQKQLKSRYGTDEHHAVVEICKEIKLSPTAIKLVDNLEWKRIPRLLKSNDIESLIPIYCDMRIGPKGILLLEERLHDLESRVNEGVYQSNLKNGKQLEELIKKSTSVELDSIGNKKLNLRFNKLTQTN